MCAPIQPPLEKKEIKQKKFLSILLVLVLLAGFSVVSFSNYGLPRLLKPNSYDLWIKPQWKLFHEMSDEELLWRASSVPQKKSYPFKREKKIAFLFLTKGPLPLYPLWEKFFSGYEMNSSIYIHSSPSYQAEFPASSPFYGRQIPSKEVEWGRMSVCDAERRLLANALLDFSNEWFLLLSETCIPLVNFTVVQTYLKYSDHTFIESFDQATGYARWRYKRGMAPEVNLSDWRKGSQWFQIDRAAAVAVVKDETLYPKFMNFCKPSCYVDEHYFPTMLNIEMAHRLANRSLTWVDWSRRGYHPATFGGGDISESFLKGILSGESCVYNGQTSSLCHLFARKFSPSALDPLLKLAPRVLGFG